jgi:hypothetical protein
VWASVLGGYRDLDPVHVSLAYPEMADLLLAIAACGDVGPLLLAMLFSVATNADVWMGC